MQKRCIFIFFFINNEKKKIAATYISVLRRDLPAIPAIAISGTRHEGNNTFRSPEVMAAV